MSVIDIPLASASDKAFEQFLICMQKEHPVSYNHLSYLKYKLYSKKYEALCAQVGVKVYHDHKAWFLATKNGEQTFLATPNSAYPSINICPKTRLMIHLSMTPKKIKSGISHTNIIDDNAMCKACEGTSYVGASVCCKEHICNKCVMKYKGECPYCRALTVVKIDKKNGLARMTKLLKIYEAEINAYIALLMLKFEN